MPLAEFTFLNAVGAMFVFMFVAMFVVLFIFLFIDVFGRTDLSGWAKAGWVLLLLILPVLGSLIYIVARSAGERREAARSPASPNVFTEGATQP